MNLALPLVIALATAFPLDQEFSSHLSGDSYEIRTICKVTKVGNSYTYLYCIKNEGKTKLKIKWELMSRALYFGHDIDMIFEVPPGENITIVLEHPDAPVFTSGKLGGFPPVRKKDFENMIKDDAQKKVKISIPDSVYFRSVSGMASGALPSSYVEIMQKVK